MQVTNGNLAEASNRKCVVGVIDRLRDAVGYDDYWALLFFLLGEQIFDIVELHEGFDGSEAVDVKVDNLVFDVQQKRVIKGDKA